MSNINCKAKYCNYANSHVTSGHKCGICNKYGHGQIECQNKDMINNLKKYYKDILLPENQCTFINCKHKETHSTISHHCHKCFKNHQSSNCIIKSLNEFIIQYGNNLFNWDSIKSFFNLNIIHSKGYLSNKFICLPMGMGCVIYIKASKDENNSIKLTILFMHSDSYGQYGERTDDTPTRDLFLLDCEDITELFNTIQMTRII